jgi:hypothetical protein
LEDKVTAALSNRELQIVSALHRTGLSLQASTVAVVMATREHARPLRELTDILRQYQNLETPEATDRGVNELREMGWLRQTESYGLWLTHQAPNLRDLLEAKLVSPGLAKEMHEMRSFLQPGIQIVGPMSDTSTYRTYLEILQSAQSEICLPMLATTPNLSSVPIIQERARNGVKVRILLGSPELTMRLRGATMERAAEDAIHGWSRHAQANSSIDIRISSSAEDMEIASCMLIDNRLLRFDIYDASTQRSLEGVMIEVTSPPNLDVNLIKVFQREFERGWNNAKPISVLGTIGWHLRKLWQWYCFGASLLLAFAFAKSQKNTWADLFLSVSATFFVTAFVSSFHSLHLFIRRLRATR